MFVQSSVFMRSKDREIRADFECGIRDAVSGCACLDDSNYRWIDDELIRREIDELIARPLSHLFHAVNEVAMADGPFDRMRGLDHVEHVDHRVEDSFEIEGILDHSF